MAPLDYSDLEISTFMDNMQEVAPPIPPITSRAGLWGRDDSISTLSPKLDDEFNNSISNINDNVRSGMRKRQRARVTISNLVKVHEVMHIHEYTDQEIDTCWYSKREIRDLKRECREIVKNEATTEECMRGLEAKTKTGSARKTQDKQLARAAVFGEQQNQRLAGSYDQNTMAHAYHEAARNATAIAQMLGMRDEQEAKQILNRAITKGFRESFTTISLCHFNFDDVRH